MRDLLTELIDCNSECTLEHTKQNSRTLRFLEDLATGWFSFDDIEFNLSEALTADELAQCVIQLTRNDSEACPAHGETEHYHLYYDHCHPGQIVLKKK